MQWLARGLVGHNQPWMHISAKSDYAVRAMAELAAAGEGSLKREQLASAQHIPIKFLGNILQQLRTAGLVTTHRGVGGGYRLTQPAHQITLADVIRAVDGPLANVRGERPEIVVYEGVAEPLRDVWIAVRASLRSVLEQVTLADVAGNRLPPLVQKLAADPQAWLASERGHRPV
jgi:Rrf2 family protein